jgi:hypothetical protein
MVSTSSPDSPSTSRPHGLDRARTAIAARRRWWFAAAATVLVVTAGGLALGVPGANGSTSHASASSYCAAARAYDDAHGRPADQQAALLGPVAALAPHDIATTVAALRANPAGTSRHAGALRTWDRFNTNHCCSCIGGPSVPQLLATPPTT